MVDPILKNFIYETKKRFIFPFLHLLQNFYIHVTTLLQPRDR